MVAFVTFAAALAFFIDSDEDREILTGVIEAKERSGSTPAGGPDIWRIRLDDSGLWIMAGAPPDSSHSLGDCVTVQVDSKSNLLTQKVNIVGPSSKCDAEHD